MVTTGLLKTSTLEKRRFAVLCYRLQEKQFALVSLVAQAQIVRRRWNLPDWTVGIRPLPVYTFVRTHGVLRMVRRPSIRGGTMPHDEAASGLTYTQQFRDGSVVLAVAGDLDLATLSSFRTWLKSATEATDNLILDFSRLRYIDSTGIHALLDVCQSLTLTGRRMALAAVPANVQRVLTVFGTDGIFRVFHTVEAAIVALRTEIPRRQ